jgi:HEAT repeat protein
MRLFKPDVDKLKARNDVGGLIKALDDPAFELRIKAIYALGNIGDRRAVNGLIEHLGDAEGSVRQESALALGKLGDPLWGNRNSYKPSFAFYT